MLLCIEHSSAHIIRLYSNKQALGHQKWFNLKEVLQKRKKGWELAGSWLLLYYLVEYELDARGGSNNLVYNSIMKQREIILFYTGKLNELANPMFRSLHFYIFWFHIHHMLLQRSSWSTNLLFTKAVCVLTGFTTSFLYMVLALFLNAIFWDQ